MFRWSSWRIEEMLAAYWPACLWTAFWLIVGVGCGVRVSQVQPFALPGARSGWVEDVAWSAAMQAPWFALVCVGSFWIWTLPGASFAVATQGYALGLALGTLCRWSIRSVGVLVVYAAPDFLLRAVPLCVAAVGGVRVAIEAWRLPFDARGRVRRPYVRAVLALYAVSVVGSAYLAWVAPTARAWM